MTETELTRLTDKLQEEKSFDNIMMVGMFSIILVSAIYAFQNALSGNVVSGSLAYEVYEPHFVSDKSEAQPLSVVLDLSGLAGRTLVEIWVKSSHAADFYIEGSLDAFNFRHVGTLSVPPGGGENHEGFMNAYPVIRVRTEAANDNEIEIVATR